MSKISVIIPVHNTAKYLQGTLQSVYAQTFDDYEIILSENCSTDGSYELCDSIARDNPRVRVLHLDIPDLSNARNCAVDVANSDVVAFIDSDDLIEPDMLSRMYEAMTRYDVDMVASGCRKVFPDRVEYPFEMDGKCVHWSNERAVYELITENISCSACTTLFRKELILKKRFPVGCFFEDNAVTYIHASMSKNGVAYIAVPFYHYIQRSGSICHSLDYKKVSDFARNYSGKLRFLSGYFPHDSEYFKNARRFNVKRFFGRFRQAAHLARTEQQIADLCKLRDEALELYELGLIRELRRKCMILKMKWFWEPFRKSLQRKNIKIR